MNIDIRSVIQEAGYKSKYSFYIRDIAFESGLQYTFHKIRPQQYRITNLSQQYHSGIPVLSQAQDAALYLTSSFSFTPRLATEWGLRYNLFYHNQLFQSVKPRLALRYRLQESIALRASYSRQNQYLHLLVTSNVGIPLDFWVAASSLIRPQSGDDVFTGNGRAYGLEIILKKNYGKLTGWASYTLGRSERTFDAINHGKTFPARFDRRHDLSIAASYAFNEKWKLLSPTRMRQGMPIHCPPPGILSTVRR
jgi:hypothetical protein